VSDLHLAWLENAGELMREPDPGPTPMLIEDVIVDQALVAVVGRWKTMKSFGLLDMSISIVTGLPWLGRLAVRPGKVVLVLEESGRAALRRRLESLCRGRGIAPVDAPDALEYLYYVANRRVKLDDGGWQNELVAVGKDLGPALLVLDPLARMKSAARDENAQKEYAPVIEFMRLLREETGASVAFVQHQGHSGEHMRGTSDLESVWESRLGFRRDANTVTITSEHREAQAGPPISFRFTWDETTRSARLVEVGDSTQAKVAAHLADHPDDSGNAVHEAIGGRRQEVLAEVKRQRESGSHFGNHPGTTGGAGGVVPAPLKGDAWEPPPSGSDRRNQRVDDVEMERLEAIAREMGL
jgi:AAA domain